MALAIPALASRPPRGCMLAVLFLMGAQATFFSPAKYGIVPELVPDEDLSRANGLLEMSTFVGDRAGHGDRRRAASCCGATGRGAIGVVLVDDRGRRHDHEPRAFRDVPAASPSGRIAINPFGEIWRAVRRLWPDRTLWMTVDRDLVLLVPGRAAADGAAAVRPARAARRRSGDHAAAHGARRRHRRRAAWSRAGCRATRSSWASCRSASIGMGVFSLRARGGAALVRAVGDRARADRVLRRAGSRAAERAAAAEAERLKRRAASWRRTTCSTPSASCWRPPCSTLLGDVAGLSREPDHRRRGRLHAACRTSTSSPGCRTSSSGSRCGCSRTRSTGSRSSAGRTSRSAARR